MRISNLLSIFRPVVGVNNQDHRDRWLEKTLHSIPEGSRILDAGAGTQVNRKFCPHLEYVSQDFAEYDGKGNAAGLQTGEFNYGKLDIISDITAIPQPDASFDAILCSEVFEHLPDPIRAVKEFSRLLKPGGYLILTAPFCSLTHFAPYHFSTGFSTYWYQRHLGEHHFSITEISPNGNYFEYLAQEINRVPSVAKRYAGSTPNFFDALGMLLVQRMLSRFSQRGQASAEFLCYGYHVLARKG